MLCAPWLPPKASTTGRSGAQPEGLAAFLGASPRAAPADSGRPVTTYLGGSQAGDRKAQADAPHERPQQPVGDAEMGVRLERRRGHAAKRRQRDDGTAGEAAAADGDVRPHLVEDAPDARHGGGQQPQRRQVSGRQQPALEALELQRERLVAAATRSTCDGVVTTTTRAPRAAASAATASAGCR